MMYTQLGRRTHYVGCGRLHKQRLQKVAIHTAEADVAGSCHRIICCGLVIAFLCSSCVTLVMLWGRHTRPVHHMLRASHRYPVVWVSHSSHADVTSYQIHSSYAEGTPLYDVGLSVTNFGNFKFLHHISQRQP